MKNKDEAIHKALKVLNCLNNDRVYENAWVKGAINACEEALEQQEVGNAEIRQMLNDIEYYQKRVEALEQPAQEPVAWIEVIDHHGHKTSKVNLFDKGLQLADGTNLYTNPHQWQELTDDEIDAIIKEKDGVFGAVVRAIEQALKEKNT